MSALRATIFRTRHKTPLTGAETRSCSQHKLLVVWALFSAAATAAVAGDALDGRPAPPGDTWSLLTDPSNWTVLQQETEIEQWDSSFNSPYAGRNSFLPGGDGERTFSLTIFLGHKLWDGAELYYNPEFFQGHGLGNTVGIAGFPNGEAVKAAFYQLHYNTSRLFIRQTIGLGGETEKVEADENQFAETVDVNRLTFSIGKFSANDFFDDNAYSHDARKQFMNWALWESAAWDYPADIVGYTSGFVAELNTKDWLLHYGIFLEPTVSNGATLQTDVAKAWAQVLEVDRRYSWDGHAGMIRPFLFWNRANMGNYDDSLASASGVPDITATRAYRSKVGAGLSWDQELTTGLGAFARLSWDDGRTETWAFTEIDSSVALGLSLQGAPWNRPDDVLGVAVVGSGLSSEHKAYLAAGGIGLDIGDGRLNYGLEEIGEVYYDVKVCKWLWMTPDFQYVDHPGFNRDRGPVPLYALRAHLEF